MRLECPHCTTSYPAELAGVKPELLPHFTVICSVCGKTFDGSVSVSVTETPSRLHRWTRGRMGTVDSVSELTVSTRKR